jgi:hypothetical protein
MGIPVRPAVELLYAEFKQLLVEKCSHFPPLQLETRSLTITTPYPIMGSRHTSNKAGKVRIPTALFQTMAEQAAAEQIETLSIGLGYCAVKTASGGLGVAYTPFDPKQQCSVLSRDEEYENGPALALLEQIQSPVTLRRALALALVNALNHARGMTLPEDRANTVMFDHLGIHAKSRVAMVGLIKPVAAALEQSGAMVEVIDKGRGIGHQQSFQERLGKWADALIMTSTSIINNTVEDILDAVGPGVRVALVGPSTPLLAPVFSGLPVHFLAGTVPLDAEGTFKAIRHGKGTPALHRFGRKVYLALS